MARVSDEVITTFQVLGESQAVGAYRRIAGAADLFSARSADLGRSQQIAGVAFGISAAALAFFGHTVAAATDDQVKFQRAAANFKGAFPSAELEAWTSGLQDLTGIDDDRIAAIAGVLGTFQIDPSQARNLTLPILNAEESLKALGITAEQVASQVGKAVQTGNAGPLRRAGIVIDQDQFAAAASQSERVRLIIAALQAQGGDAAVMFRDTLPGALRALTTEMNTVEEGIGSGLVGPLRAGAEAATLLLRGFNALPGPIKATVGIVGTVLAGAVAAYAIGTGVAFNNTIRLAEAHFLAARGAAAQATATSGLSASLTAAGFAGAAARGGGSTAALAAQYGLSPGLVAAGLGRTTPASTGAAGFRAFLGTPGAQVAGAAGLIGAGLSFLPPSGDRGLDETKDVIAGALQGASAGAFLGSLAGPAGTAIGAGIGAALGGGAAFFADQQQDRDSKKAATTPGEDAIVDELRKQNQKLQDQLDALKDIKAGNALPFSDLAGRDQISALLD